MKYEPAMWDGLSAIVAKVLTQIIIFIRMKGQVNDF